LVGSWNVCSRSHDAMIRVYDAAALFGNRKAASACDINENLNRRFHPSQHKKPK